jgi:hypothetical protein
VMMRFRARRCAVRDPVLASRIDPMRARRVEQYRLPPGHR